MEQIKRIGADQALALTKIFNRRWWWTTLLVIAGMFFLVRLGIWQLDRLEERRANNAFELSQWRQEPFRADRDALPGDLDTLANRKVTVEGRFDYANQQIWEYQTFLQQTGVRLVTPLVFENEDTGQEQALLVVRGWVPNSADEAWEQYNEDEDVSIFGRVFKSQLLPNGEMPTAPSEQTNRWSYINTELIQPNLPYELLPVILVQLPAQGRTYNDTPIREIWVPSFTEGNHLSYAVQWFSFALIFGFGYLQFILWQERREERLAAEEEQAEEGLAEEKRAGEELVHAGEI